ncbi:Ankyrin repeat protein [Corynebacterium occultum]|uniref:Ankyrin repeat protein n=1 Tax=Corynebacterium occultum TaxID=2675219 RepID=A0A6B8WDE4_9CORY|nr:ankyrin repeat domain-containing protein [Corynebacterium occultum]QGU08020.1 Ankyrin repeat protein [Corynebacterium occultum]
MENTQNQPNELPEDVQQLVTKLFELARTEGAEAAATLGAYIDQGVDVNLRNQEGNTLLMLAAYNGATEVLEALIARGADVNELNERGQSPLAGAIFKREDLVIEQLILAGADPLAGHPTAVDCAKMFGREDLLTRFGAGE